MSTSEPEEFIVVEKIPAGVTVSLEVAMFYGWITREEAIASGWTPPAPLPRLTRWKWAARNWWHEHWPRIHLGPCNHEECM